RGDADLDRRNTFVGNMVYELPHFEHLGDVGSTILGDWQVNFIASFYSGAPVDVVSGVNTAGLASAGPQRPDLVSGVPIYLDNDNDPTTYLNPAAFSLPGVGSFGSLGRGLIRGPGIANLDASLSKNFHIGERFGIQFRAQ